MVLPSLSLSLLIPTWQRLAKYLCSRHGGEDCSREVATVNTSFQGAHSLDGKIIDI